MNLKSLCMQDILLLSNTVLLQYYECCKNAAISDEREREMRSLRCNLDLNQNIFKEQHCQRHKTPHICSQQLLIVVLTDLLPLFITIFSIL